MTKAKTKDAEPALFGDTETAHTVVREGNVKKNINPPSKSQAAPRKGTAIAVATPAAPVSMLEIIARIAADPNIDTDKMRAVIEIQRDTEAKQQFHDALIALDEKLPRINKDGKIEFKDTTKKPIRFASFENLNRRIKPLIRAYGLRLNFQPDTGPNGQGIVVHCHLTRGLYRESCTVPVSTAPTSPAMNGLQSVGAAISYAKRYGAIALLNIETEAPQDRDVDGNAPRVTSKADKKKDAAIDKKELAALEKAINECGVPLSTVLAKYEIKDLAEMPPTSLQEALDACARFKAANASRRQ